jgi:hypothetical protein
MSVAFSVKVSGDPPCRVLAVDLAKRYCELSGAGAVEVAASGAAVAVAIEAVADGERALDLTFSRTGDFVDVEISCGGRTERCRLSLSN